MWPGGRDKAVSCKMDDLIIAEIIALKQSRIAETFLDYDITDLDSQTLLRQIKLV